MSDGIKDGEHGRLLGKGKERPVRADYLCAYLEARFNSGALHHTAMLAERNKGDR